MLEVSPNVVFVFEAYLEATVHVALNVEVLFFAGSTYLESIAIRRQRATSFHITNLESPIVGRSSATSARRNGRRTSPT